MTPKAYSYIRFSSPEQARGDSLRRQTAKAEAWCAERGIELDDSLRDLGVSAFQGANRTMGALRSFLDMVERQEIAHGSYLIVESLDRLSRETVVDAATQLFALIQAGIIVVTLSDGQEYSSARLRQDWTPLVISLAVMARAHVESRVKSERVGEAWRQKKAAARNEGRPVTSRCPEWLELRRGRFEELGERVDVVRRIFHETIAGYGRREIVRRLNSEPVEPFRGGKGWQTSSIAKIIQNRAVLGEYQPHSGTHRGRNRSPEGDPIPDYYPRIIDDETFWRAQAAVADRRQQSAGRRGETGAHILRGLAKCRDCGAAMHIVNKGRPPKGAVYLVCSTNRRAAGCDNARAWRVDRLERAVLLGITAVDIGALVSLDTHSGDGRHRVAALRAEVGELEKRRGLLLALVETGDEAAVSRFKEIAAAIKLKKEELKSTSADLAISESDAGVVSRIVEVIVLSQQIDEATAAARKDARIRLSAVLRKVIDRIEFDALVGAVMVLPPRDYWRIKSEGDYGFRSDASGLYMLIEDNPSQEAKDQFFGELGYID